MSRCGPSGNNVGWGTPIQVRNSAQPQNWTSIIRSAPQLPSEGGSFATVMTALRNVEESAVLSSAVHNLGLLRFGNGGASVELEFDWIAGNQFSIPAASQVEILARMDRIPDVVTAGTIDFFSAFVAWQTARPTTNAALQRSYYMTVDALSTSTPIRVPPLATSCYVMPTTPGVTMSLLRIEGIDSLVGTRLTQVSSAANGLAVQFAGQTRFVQITNLDANPADIVFVWVYAL